MWDEFYTPPTPIDLNASQDLQDMLTDPLYRSFAVYYPIIHEMHKVEKGAKNNRQQRIINGEVTIKVENPIYSPENSKQSQAEFIFAVLVKREANSLYAAKKQRGGNGRENICVEEEVELQSYVEMKAITTEMNGCLGGCIWTIKSGEFRIQAMVKRNLSDLQLFALERETELIQCALPFITIWTLKI